MHISACEYMLWAVVFVGVMRVCVVLPFICAHMFACIKCARMNECVHVYMYVCVHVCAGVCIYV